MARACCAGQGRQVGDLDSFWVVYLWLVNDNVSPHVYLHMPAVLDTKCEEELLISLRAAETLQLAEDTLMSGEQNAGAARKYKTLLTYKPVRVLVPMLNERDGKAAFYMPRWLNCSRCGKVALPSKAHSPLIAVADQHVKEAGAQAIAMVGDRSGAWLQTSSTKHAQHVMDQEHALLGLKAMDKLGLHLDREHCAFRTVKMRTIRRRDDTF